ncbi:MAG: MFS transporter [Myxococcales bacterium]|nr:MFS transporter [Myxococcales bacterium]
MSLLTRTLLASCLGFLFSAADIVLLIFFQQSIADDLGVPLGQVRAVLGVGLLGSAVGGLFFAPLGDRLGRVRALSLAVVVYSVATAGLALAPNLLVLALLRFLSGIGTGGEWSLGFALAAEGSPAHRRGLVGGIVASMFNIGTFLAIVLYQSGLGWRLAFGLMLLPALLGLWVRRGVPEPATFLEMKAARDHGGAGQAIATQLRRPPVRAAYSRPHRRTTLLLTLLFGVLNFAFYGFSTVFFQYVQAPSTAGGLGLSPSDELPFQLTLNVTALIGILVAGALSDRLGRRATVGLFAGLGALGFAGVFLVVSGSAASTAGVPPGLLPAFALGCLAFGINGVLGAYLPELFPTHLRSTGPGLSQNLGKGVGGLLGPLLAGRWADAYGFAVALGLPSIAFLLVMLIASRLPVVGGRRLEAVETDGANDCAPD